MTARATARPYSTALFNVVGHDEAGTAAEAALRALVAAISTHEELRQVLESPAVPSAKKRAILDDLMSAAGSVPPEARRLVLLLAERDETALLADVAADFSSRLRLARNILEAEVVTAAPLGPDRAAALSAALSRAAGGRVQLTERVDPTIVGGLVARVGSTVYDGSVTRRIERLRQELLGDA